MRPPSKLCSHPKTLLAAIVFIVGFNVAVWAVSEYACYRLDQVTQE